MGPIVAIVGYEKVDETTIQCQQCVKKSVAPNFQEDIQVYRNV